MKIGVVSDTHLRDGEKLPAELIAGLKGVEMILHAGDLVVLGVIGELERIAPVKAVRGNMDGPAVRDRLPAKQIIEAAGRRIGLIHGSGAPLLLAERLRREFEGVDVIVFGHSHQATRAMVDGVLMLNPGSPTDHSFTPRRSYGIIELRETIETEIVGLP